MDRTRALQRVDERLLEAVVAHRPRVAERPARLVANMGRGGLAWIALAAVARRRRAEDSPPLPVTAATVGGVYLGSMLLARLLKRDRPCHRLTIEPLVECPGGPAFPSDQTAGAFAGAVLLAHAVPNARLPLISAAALIGAARVYCGVHWPSDVVGGAAVGSVAAVAAARATQRSESEGPPAQTPTS